MREKIMSEVLRYEVDLNNLPALTESQQAEIKILSELPDDDIDFSDIPPLTDEFWDKAKPVKRSLRLADDPNEKEILEFIENAQDYREWI